MWDENVNRCVNETDCTCGILNGNLYHEGDLVSEISDDCQERVSIFKLALRSRLALLSRLRFILVPKLETAKICQVKSQKKIFYLKIYNCFHRFILIDKNSTYKVHVFLR